MGPNSKRMPKIYIFRKIIAAVTSNLRILKLSLLSLCFRNLKKMPGELKLQNIRRTQNIASQLSNAASNNYLCPFTRHIG